MRTVYTEILLAVSGNLGHIWAYYGAHFKSELYLTLEQMVSEIKLKLNSRFLCINSIVKRNSSTEET